MKGRFRAYLELIRLPNLFTSAADVLAGFLYVGGRFDDWYALLGLIGASMCLYAGGVTLNDVCDAERDRHNRPTRPIPSGRVSLRAARRLALGLLLTGVVLAVVVSARAGAVAALLAASIVLYDDLFKLTVVGPVFMGLCRALNLALGISETEELFTTLTVTPVCLMWLYVASLTLFARHESGATRPFELWIGTAGVCLAVAFLGLIPGMLADRHVGAQLLALGLVCVLGFTGTRAAVRPSPRTVQTAVARFVISLVLFDTCLAWAAAGPAGALAVASLLIPTVLLARMFEMS